jgi:hypothetical protein
VSAVVDFLQSIREKKSLVIQGYAARPVSDPIVRAIKAHFPYPAGDFRPSTRIVEPVLFDTFIFEPLPPQNCHVLLERACGWCFPTTCDSCYTQCYAACCDYDKLVSSVSCCFLWWLTGCGCTVPSFLCCDVLFRLVCCCCCSCGRWKTFRNDLRRELFELDNSITSVRRYFGLFNVPTDTYVAALSVALPQLQDQVGKSSNFYVKLLDKPWDRLRLVLLTLYSLDLPREIIKLLYLNFLLVVDEHSSISLV